MRILWAVVFCLIVGTAYAADFDSTRCAPSHDDIVHGNVVGGTSLADSVRSRGFDPALLHPEFLPAMEAKLEAIPADAGADRVADAVVDLIFQYKPKEFLGSKISLLSEGVSAWHRSKQKVGAAKPTTTAEGSLASVLRTDPALVAAKLPLNDSFWGALEKEID